MALAGTNGQWEWRSSRHGSGWLVSLLLHGGALVIVMHGALDLRPPHKPETFQWNVVLTPAPTPTATPAAAPSPTPSEPAEPTPPAPSHRPRSQPQRAPAPQPVVRQVIERTPTVRTMETVQREAVAVRPIDREVTRQAAQVTETSTVESTQPVERTAMQERQAIEQVERAAVVEARAAPQQREAAIQHGVREMEPAEVQSVTSQEAVTPIVQATVTRERATAAVETPPIQQVEPIVKATETKVEPFNASTPRDALQHRNVEARPTAQADFGWLAESLWNRIEQFKRYPSLARARRWEGKVVLEAVIRHDGEILECQIAESSGHRVLDQDALAVLRKASPLPLKHPLGRARVTILVPIAYRLES